MQVVRRKRPRFRAEECPVDELSDSASANRLWESRKSCEIVHWGPDACEFNINPATGNKRLVILLPNANTAIMPGGAITIFQFAAEIAKYGINILFCALQVEARSTSDFKNGLRRNLGLEKEVLNKFEIVDARKGYSLNLGDKIMATASWVFPLAKNLSKRCGCAFPAYLIQDVEPMFWGFGPNHAELMLTYGEDCLPIISTPTLARMICNLGEGTFAKKFASRALIFLPSIDVGLFYPDFYDGEKKRLLAYTPFGILEQRNMPALIMEAISRMVEDDLLKADEWEIRCIGAPDEIPWSFAGDLCTTMLPPLPYLELAEEIRSASLGISLILSPHPGFMLFEFAASGIPVITNTYLNKTEEILKEISPNIYPVPPTFDGIAAKLRLMLQNGLYKTPDQASEKPILNLPPTWTESFAPLMPSFMDWFNA